MLLLKCCTQYASKLGKISSGHRTGKGHSSFQPQRKAMWKDIQATTHLHSSHTLAKEKKVKSFSHVWLFATPWTVAYHVPPSMGFPGKNTGVGCHFLLQEIFRNQGLNPGLPHCRQTLYHLRHQGSAQNSPIQASTVHAPWISRC